MTTEWFYKTATNEERGPYTPADLKRLGLDGHIKPMTMVRKGTDGRWVLASKVKGLLDGEAVSEKAVAPVSIIHSRPIKLVSNEPNQESKAYSPPVPYPLSKPKDVEDAEFTVVRPKQGMSPILLVSSSIGGTLLAVGIIALATGMFRGSDKTNQNSVAQNNTAKDPSVTSGKSNWDQSIKNHQPTKQQPITSQTDRYTNPEDVLKAYFSAPTWEERLPWVLNPESVRTQMAARYRNSNLLTVIKKIQPGTIYPLEKTSFAVGERVILKINVSQGYPYHEYLRYVLEKTDEGFKVDWLESMKLDGEDDERANQKELQLVDPLLEVQVLKVYQSSPSHTNLDIKVVNKSNKFISFWKVEADLHDAGGNYLGHDSTNGSNLRPGQSVTGKIIYSDIRAANVNSWKLSLGDVNVDLGGGRKREATKYYTLKEIR
jgi:hypothetical protein